MMPARAAVVADAAASKDTELVTTVAGAAAAGAASSAVGNGAARQGSRIVIPDDVLPADKRRDRLGRMMDACKILLEELGEDVSRDGIAKTPLRMAKALLECTEGYAQDPREILGSALFDVDAGGGMVLVKDIAFHSMCEHHVLPFAGKAHIAYMPGDRVVGLSKLARATDAIAKRLQVQERLTRQIAEAVRDAVGAADVAVITTAEHMCMSMRGASKPGAATTSTVFLGRFATDSTLQTQLLMQLK